MTVDEIAQSDVGTIQGKLAKKVGRKLGFGVFSESADQLGRGQVYPLAGRLITEREMERLL